MIDDDQPLDERLAQADREIRCARIAEEIRELGGDPTEFIGEGPVTDNMLLGLETILAWDGGRFCSHRGWLARRGLGFAPPAELRGRRLKRELWRLIEGLAQAGVTLAHTNHLCDAALYARLWHEVLPEKVQEKDRRPEWGCVWSGAPAISNPELWLTHYATKEERRRWLKFDPPGTVLPRRRRAPFRRDHRLPGMD